MKVLTKHKPWSASANAKEIKQNNKTNNINENTLILDETKEEPYGRIASKNCWRAETSTDYFISVISVWIIKTSMSVAEKSNIKDSQC